MADNWWGGAEGSRPTSEDYRKAGWSWRTDREEWEPPAGWVMGPGTIDNPFGGQYVPPADFKPLVQPTLRVTPGMATEQLQELTKQAPITRPRFVETGEGGYTTYDYYDPASQAKQLLAQPAQVSTDYIRNNFPSLAQLPQSVLNQMGQDWRTAYAHIQKMPEQSASGWWGGKGGAEGLVPVPIRIGKDNRPELPVGGGGEMFAEALPYITYSPEYGLAVPKAGMRPYDSGFSFLDFVGAAAPGIALSAILGPAGMGLSLPAAGAVSGGLSAALNDGNILKGALTGGALGGLGQMATPAISSAVGATGLTGAAADAVKAGALAAGKAVLTGGDPLQAALVAATGAGVGSTVASADALKELDPTVAKALTAAASGAARAAVGGGDPVTAALTSAINVGTKAITGAAPGATASAPAPTTSTQDILSQLGAQETEAQQLQQILADAGIAPEQRGLLAGDYKQEGVGDVLARGAESALGALVPSAQASGQDRVVLPQPTEAGGAQPSDYKYFFDVMSKGDPQTAYAGLSADEKAAVDRAGQEFQASSETRKGDLLSAYKSGELTPTETPTESWIDRGMLGAEAPASMQDILGVLGQQQTQQEAMQKALSDYAKPEIPTSTPVNADAAIAALERATGQKIAAGDADILARLAEQTAAQEQTEAALRGEISGLGGTFQQQLSAGQKATQTQFEGVDSRITQLQQQGLTQAEATSQALRELSGGQAALSQELAQATAQQQSDQAAMEAALRGEISGVGTTFDKRLSDILAQQEEEQASMQTALTGYDKRILDLMAQGESEQQAMQQALAEVQASQAAQQAATQQQITGVQTGLGQQIGQIGTTLGGQIAGLGTQLTAAKQQAAQAQQQANMSTLFGLLGGFGGQQAAPQAAAPITPANIQYVYDIGGKSIFANPQQEKAFVSPYAEGGTVEDLMKILRG